MSFAIFPKAFSVGFASRAAPPPVQHPPADNPQETQPSQATPADTTDIQSIKIIPDDLEANVEESLDQGAGNEAPQPIKIIPDDLETNVEGGVNQDSGNNVRTKYQVNFESNEVVIKVVDESGEEVRQIPDPEQLELNHRIREYQKLISEDTEA
ncbi:MAG: flagellar protein FlaG [Nitrospinaceae bacterium]